MSEKYYKIEPSLEDERVAYIDDWEFTNWPNKPKGEIIKNPNGSFSVIMEKDFIPLVEQLKNMFDNGLSPENGTYIGEAVLIGKNEPLDCIFGNYINQNEGLVISNKLLHLLKKYKLPKHFIYELPLIKKRRIFYDYSFILFKKESKNLDYDVQLFIECDEKIICVSEKIKDDIINSEIKGCKFTLFKK